MALATDFMRFPNDASSRSDSVSGLVLFEPGSAVGVVPVTIGVNGLVPLTIGVDGVVPLTIGVDGAVIVEGVLKVVVCSSLSTPSPVALWPSRVTVSLEIAAPGPSALGPTSGASCKEGGSRSVPMDGVDKDAGTVV
eukprot:3651471-Rhodomonas_salina.2